MRKGDGVFVRHCGVQASVLLLVSTFAAAANAGPGDPALVEAASRQDSPAVRALLKQKVDVNARSSDGSTALLWLAHWNDVGHGGSAARAGADANAANDFRMTPLSQACTNASRRWCGCC